MNRQHETVQCSLTCDENPCPARVLWVCFHFAGRPQTNVVSPLAVGTLLRPRTPRLKVSVIALVTPPIITSRRISPVVSNTPEPFLQKTNSYHSSRFHSTRYILTDHLQRATTPHTTTYNHIQPQSCPPTQLLNPAFQWILSPRISLLRVRRASQRKWRKEHRLVFSMSLASLTGSFCD